MHFLRLFLTATWVGLQCVILVFPDHTHLQFGLLPRSHIHGSPRRFHYGSNLTDDPGSAIFRRPIRMPNGVATGFDVSTNDYIEKDPFGDMIDTVC